MSYTPGDQVTWFKKKPGSTYPTQLIPAKVYYLTASKIAIQVIEPTGEVVVKYVSADAIEPGIRLSTMRKL